MDEALLHEMAAKAGGRFKLTGIVQKRLVELMVQRADVIVKNCGGRPIRLVVEEIGREMGILGPEGAKELVESTAGEGAE